MTSPHKLYPLLFTLLLTHSVVFAQKKLAQTGFQYLSVGADARASAMGEAYTTIGGNSGAIFYNPAGLSSIRSAFDLAFNHSGWIADIKHYAFSLALNPRGGRYGVFGLSVMAVDYGEVEGTMVWENDQGYVDTEIIEPSALAIGIGYGRSLTDKFQIGGQIKYVVQSFGRSAIPDAGLRKNIADVLAFDFGTIYHTGYKSFAFGMSVRNFSQEVKFENESFQLPLTFRIGVSADALDFMMDDHQDHSLLFALDALHPRSYPEYIGFGSEYAFKKIIALRVGYISAQEEYGLTMGFGLHSDWLCADYSYTPFGVFDSVQRLTVSFRR